MDDVVADAETVLVMGSALSGRRRLLHQILRTWGMTPVIISILQPADRLRQVHSQLHDPADPPTSETVVAGATTDRSTGDSNCPLVVDCLSNTFGQSPTDTRRTKYAQHPSNLTSIGTKFTEVVTERSDEQLAVGIDAISPLLQYVSAREAYRFVHLIVQHAAGASWPVAATLDPTAHDTLDSERFISIFDVILETRLTDEGDQEFRIRHPDQSAWQPI
jgi:hypothetical protein